MRSQTDGRPNGGSGRATAGFRELPKARTAHGAGEGAASSNDRCRPMARGVGGCHRGVRRSHRSAWLSCSTAGLALPSYGALRRRPRAGSRAVGGGPAGTRSAAKRP